MKTLIRILALFIIVNAATLQAPVKAQVRVGVSFQIFFDQLSPYGQWVNYPGYGYGWIPAVDPGFSPYATAGHWVFTDYGWTWVSDYTWGWAAFHYGRWNYDPWYGWIWIPDNVWGPAWVSWRESPGYYGWAPMGWGSNYYDGYDHWTFCGDRYFDQPDQDRYYIDQSNNTTIINNSTVINNTYVDRNNNTSYVAGPNVSEVRRRTGRTIDPVAVVASNTPGEKISRSELSIYKPPVSQNNARGQLAAPAHVANLQDVKPRANNNGSVAQANVNPARGNGAALQTTRQDNSNAAVKQGQQQPRAQQTMPVQDKQAVPMPQRSPVKQQPSKQLQQNPSVKTEQQKRMNATENGAMKSSPSYGSGQQHQQPMTSPDHNVKQQPVQMHNNTPQHNRQQVNAPQSNDVKQQPAQSHNTAPRVNQQQPQHANAPQRNDRPQAYTQPKSSSVEVDRNASVVQKGQGQPNQNSHRKQ